MINTRTVEAVHTHTHTHTRDLNNKINNNTIKEKYKKEGNIILPCINIDAR